MIDKREKSRCFLEKNSKDKCEGKNKALKNIWRSNGTLRELHMKNICQIIQLECRKQDFL